MRGLFGVLSLATTLFFLLWLVGAIDVLREDSPFGSVTALKVFGTIVFCTDSGVYEGLCAAGRSLGG